LLMRFLIQWEVTIRFTYFLFLAPHACKIIIIIAGAQEHLGSVLYDPMVSMLNEQILMITLMVIAGGKKKNVVGEKDKENKVRI